MKKLFLFSLLLTTLLSCQDRGNTEMKILSFNLHCFDGDWNKRLTILASEVAKISPDLIALQEVCADETNDTLKTLSQKLEENGYSIKATHSKFTHRAWDKYDELVAMISKREIEEHEEDFLPASPLQRAYVALKIEGLWFVGTHLEYLDPKYRKEELEFLANRFQNEPHLILGDLNSNPTDPEQQLLKEKGYRPFFPGPTYPARNPSETYDGFWLSEDFPKAKKEAAKTLFKGLDLSDHLGVLLELKN